MQRWSYWLADCVFWFKIKKYTINDSHFIILKYSDFSSLFPVKISHFCQNMIIKNDKKTLYFFIYFISFGRGTYWIFIFSAHSNFFSNYGKQPSVVPEKSYFICTNSCEVLTEYDIWGNSNPSIWIYRYLGNREKKIIFKNVVRQYLPEVILCQFMPMFSWK